jgi:hypothetical protein
MREVFYVKHISPEGHIAYLLETEDQNAQITWGPFYRKAEPFDTYSAALQYMETYAGQAGHYAIEKYFVK